MRPGSFSLACHFELFVSDGAWHQTRLAPPGFFLNCMLSSKLSDFSALPTWTFPITLPRFRGDVSWKSAPERLLPSRLPSRLPGLWEPSDWRIPRAEGATYPSSIQSSVIADSSHAELSLSSLEQLLALSPPARPLPILARWPSASSTGTDS
mmetsp:Transcript_5693/g.13209  ORF Transcript_5693/g.13209 Transcript_5693/m.13209 type:complete len:152 (+) Transcript_5693:314-769(+)